MAIHDWDEITAIGTAIAAGFTAVMAVVTAVMAWYTRKAIKEGQEQRKDANDHFVLSRNQDKQHHEDAFRPLLVLTPSNSVDVFDRKDILDVLNHPRMPVIIVNCALCNIGSGAALNVRLSARSDRRTGFGTTRELAPLAADGRFTDGAERIEMPVILSSGFNAQDCNNLLNGLWLLVLEYQDVFGNTFHTIHSKHAGEPWTLVGRGLAPDFTPEQPAMVEQAIASPQEDRSGAAWLGM